MKSFEKLLLGLKRLPGIGPKQAERLSLYLLRAPLSEVEALVHALREVRAKVRPCLLCFNYTEKDRCALCEDPARDKSILCVVEHPTDVSAIERTRNFRGLYHVLHGRLSPLQGLGPEALRIRELLGRIQGHNGVREVILATDPDTEGEATALYLASLLKELPVLVTRIAQGVPMGGDLDYLDEKTLSCALLSRREMA